MQRIDVSSAAPTLPAPAALGTPGYFTDGDPIAAVPATVVDADWLNLVQEELMGVVTGGNIAPSKTDRGQMLEAILALILGGANATIAAEGSISLAGGLLVIKWGTATVQPTSASGFVTHNFPVQFPNACFGIVGSPTAPTEPSNWNPVTAAFLSKTAQGFNLNVDSTDPAHNITQAVPVFYVAIGN